MIESYDVAARPANSPPSLADALKASLRAVALTYVGERRRTGPRVTVTAGGKTTGPLPHVVRYSTTGLAWGHEGNGPADLARSLLIHALGDDALCPLCGGRGQTIAEAGGPVPYDPDTHYLVDAEKCCQCNGACYRPVPHQDFMREHVATWSPGGWTITHAEILAWLAARGYDPRGG